jgi:hypothetical protein
VVYSIFYTFSAFTVFPEAMASHSPVAVEYPEFIVIPWIGGDQAKFVI